ncbi:MAG: hypothetical protein RID91_21915 [Azospirillaceae bacterium]
MSRFRVETMIAPVARLPRLRVERGRRARRRPVATPALAALAWLLVALGVAGPAEAAMEIRAWDHGPYGRLVFDWDVGTGATIEPGADRIVVRTDRPVDAPTGPALANLSAYLEAIRVSPDGRTVTLETTGPLDVDRVAVDYGLVLDFRKSEAPTTAAAAGAPDAPAPQGTAPAPGEAPVVAVRGGDRSGFSRLVFDWPEPTDVALEREGERLVVRFDRPGRLDASPLDDTALERVTGIEGFATERGLAVAARVPVAARVRHFTSGLDVIVDVLDPAVGAPPSVAAAPPSGGEAGAGATPPPSDATASPETAAAPATPAPPARVASAPILVPSFEASPDDSLTAMLPTGPDSALAVFERGGRLWLVVAEAGAEAEAEGAGGPEIGAIAAAAEAAFGPGETVVGTGGVAFVHPLSREAADRRPVIDRVPEGWRVTLAEADAAGRSASRLAVTPQPDYPLGPRLLAVTGPDTRPVGLVDPVLGDRLQVVPVREAGSGLGDARRFAQFALLATAQGLAVEPGADGLVFRPVDAGVAIGAEGGLVLSDPADLPQVAETGAEGGMLDIPAWHAGEDGFLEARQALQRAAAMAPPERRDAARLDVARLMIAHGMGAESLGLLDLVARSTPDIVGRPEYRVLRGAAALLDDDPPAALSDFDAAGFEEGRQAALWRGAALAESGDWPAAAADFSRAGELISAYPDPLRRRFMLDGIEAALRTGSPDRAEEGLDWLDAETAGASEARPRVVALRARLAESRGDTETARAIWRRLAEGDDRYHATRAALALDRLERAAGARTPEESIEALEALRFAWRGDALEAEVLKRLGEAEWDAGHFADAFSTWETASRVAPGTAPAVEAGRAIEARFAELFGTDRLESVPVLDAWAVFRARRELVPEGEDGDLMIEAMADRLASIDLLDRAAGLLDGMIEERADTDLDRARLGARVAGLHLLDDAPEAALDALDRTDGIDAPAPAGEPAGTDGTPVAAADSPAPESPEPEAEPASEPEPPGDPLRRAFDEALAEVLAEQDAAGQPIDLSGTPIDIGPAEPANSVDSADLPEPADPASADAPASATAPIPTPPASIDLAAAPGAAGADATAEADAPWRDAPGGEALARERRLLRARALADTGAPERALAALGDDHAPLVDRARVEIARRAGLWDGAAAALDRLIGPPPRLGEAIEPERAGLVVERAVALSLADDTAALDEMAIAFGPAMENSDFANTFAVLTRTRGALGPADDLETVRRQVAEVDVFEDFLERYRSASPGAIE